MRPGTSKLAAALGACALLGIVGPASAAAAGLEASARPAPIGGASASGGTIVLTLTGTPAATSTNVSIDPATGELVVREATEATSPGDPCTPAAGTPTFEFRCPAGTIGAIVGDLGLGNDRFITARNVGVLIGAQVGGQPRPMRGGGGADVIFGGRLGDALFGSAGRDRLGGRGGSDLLNGGPGRDRLLGGPVGDGLFGGPGADFLNGGPGRDFCNGGGGRDGDRACFVSRSVP